MGVGIVLRGFMLTKLGNLEHIDPVMRGHSVQQIDEIENIHIAKAKIFRHVLPPEAWWTHTINIRRYIFDNTGHRVVQPLYTEGCGVDVKCVTHYSDVIMSVTASQVIGVSIVCSTFLSGADQRIHQSSASLVFVRGIHRWLVDSPRKGPVRWKMFPFDYVIMSKTFFFSAEWVSALLVNC